MLSFLREQGASELPAQSQADSPGRADSEALDNAPNPEASQQYLTVAARNKDVHKSTILVTVLFGIGLLSLWFMIKKSAPQTATGSSTDTQETQIEAAIARLTGVSSELFSRMDQIVDKFYEFSNVLQVQVNELVKNPFELEMFLSSLKGKVAAQQADIDINAELVREQRIRQKASALSLSTIMQTEQGNCCMIDDKVLYEGDLINGFRVIQISDDFVKIRWQDGKDDTAQSGTSSPAPEIILKLSE